MIKKTFASLLREVITVEYLNCEDTWLSLVNLRAQVRALYDNKNNGEAFIAMQMIDNSFYQFNIRYNQQIKSNMRIIYKERIFYIKRIINKDELNQIMIIIAQENL